LNFVPQIPKENILIIASRGDKLCPFEHVVALCEKWSWPRHHFMTGGHWLVLNPKERGSAWYTFLADMGFIEKRI
jgi:predicted alpha/beta hydrolase family esterase